MKSILDCNHTDKMTRALLALETLSVMFDEGGISQEDFSNDVYCISHAVQCRCKNPHSDWLVKIEEIESVAKKYCFYDVEKIIGVN